MAILASSVPCFGLSYKNGICLFIACQVGETVSIGEGRDRCI